MIYSASLNNASDEGYYIIDIREPDECLRRPLDLADEQIPMEALLRFHQQYLDKNTKYLLVCAKGMRATRSAQHLRELGYDNVYAFPNSW